MLVSETVGGMLLIRVTEERLDTAAVIRFKERLRELVAVPSRRVVLDMTKVRFLDSSGLGALVFAMKHVAPGRRLELAGLSAPVDRVLRLTRMDTVFRIHPSLDTGLRHGA